MLGNIYRHLAFSIEVWRAMTSSDWSRVLCWILGAEVHHPEGWIETEQESWLVFQKVIKRLILTILVRPIRSWYLVNNKSETDCIFEDINVGSRGFRSIASIPLGRVEHCWNALRRGNLQQMRRMLEDNNIWNILREIWWQSPWLHSTTY